MWAGRERERHGRVWVRREKEGDISTHSKKNEHMLRSEVGIKRVKTQTFHGSIYYSRQMILKTKKLIYITLHDFNNSSLFPTMIRR